MSDKDYSDEQAGLISEMVLGGGDAASSKGELLTDPEQIDNEGLRDSFTIKLEETLRETEEAILSIADLDPTDREARSWEIARKVIESFQPVPFFIWRLANYVLGKPGQATEVSDGLVFGLRRLLFATASDELLGIGEKV
ncbi:MAG: hypothetical protein KDD42_06690, partial [Bdellovibrionales bacterium]|nr:hypothetical protein [Bdellovibrionales bacterium]